MSSVRKYDAAAGACSVFPQSVNQFGCRRVAWLVWSDEAGPEEAGASRIGSAEATGNSATTSPGTMAKRRVGCGSSSYGGCLKNFPWASDNFLRRSPAVADPIVCQA
jgi:hypothetical protein